jgi:hypothetical protein
MPPRHKCAATSCETMIPRGMLMCRDHWTKLPRLLKSAIYETWNRGSPKSGYVANVREAVRFVDALGAAGDEGANA